MKEIRRRTRVVGAFPDGQSCLNLAAARLRYIAGTAWSRQVLHEHATSLSAASHANRSRRLIKCAKDSGHHPYLGHKSIQHTVRYTELAPTRFKDFWRG
jgi:hypothetical protein